MSDAKLKTRIKNLVKDTLFEYGFSLVKPRLIERQVDGLIQGVDFQPGSGHLSGKYTLNVYWRFDYIEKDHISFDANRRIGDLANTNDLWLSREAENLESDFEKVKSYFYETILPYFEKYSSIQRLVEAYDRGEISKQHAFGTDLGWQCFNSGFSYAAINNKNLAIIELREVINKHSSNPYDWVQKRKKIAHNKLTELESA